MSTSNWSNANYSPEVPMMTNGRPMPAGNVPALFLTDPGTAQTWAKNKNAFFEAGSRPQLHDIRFGEIVFALEEQPHFSGQAYGRTALNGYDGPFGYSLSEAKKKLLIKLPGVQHKLLRERYLASLATAGIRILGDALNNDDLVNPRTGNFNHKKESTVQNGGLSSFWNEMDFMKTRQVVRARCPTETEIKNRASIQQKCQGIDQEKITLIVEAVDNMSFSQRHMDMLTAYMRCPELHMELAILCRNRIAASEILSFELLAQADVITAIRSIGWGMDMGWVRSNLPFTNAEISGMIDGSLVGGAVPDYTQMVIGRPDTADFRVNPMFSIIPMLCRPGTKELAYQPTSQLMSAPPGTLPAMPAEINRIQGAVRSEDVEPILASLMRVIVPTDASRDDSKFGGVPKKFLDTNEGNQFALAALTCLKHRLYTQPAVNDPKIVRFWPGSYRNDLNQLDNRFYTPGTGPASVGLANRTPDTDKQTGLWLAATQMRAQTGAIAYAGSWNAFHNTVQGVVNEGGGKGNRVTYIRSHAGTC